MNEKELFRAAAQIAGEMAGAAYGKTLNVEEIAKKSLEIARKIEEEMRGPIESRPVDQLTDAELEAIVKRGL